MSLFNELKRRNVIRVATAYIVLAWLVIQVVETIFPAFGFGDAAVRIAATIGLLGFIPTLVFAWVFEITPEGVRKEIEIDRSESITQQTGKLLDRIILVILSLALLYFIIDKFILAEQREASIAESAREQGRFNALGRSRGAPSIAVLPFADMSAQGDQEYFADGISEELLNTLAKIPQLRVISRTSAFSFKGQNIDIIEIAKRLKVSHIIEGSVRMAGQQVRITAQLIETETDSHLWSETYDHDIDNIFVTQEEIAAAVMQELELRLLPSAHSTYETSSAAYSLYLRARHLSNQVSVTSLEKSRDLVLQALDLDSNYADAWIQLAVIYDRMMSLQIMDAQQGSRLSANAARKALSIAPDSAKANEAMGWIIQRDEKNLQEAAAYFQRAIKIEPTNITVLGNAAIFLSTLGRQDEALSVTEYQVSRDPANSVAYNNLGMRYRFLDQHDNANHAFKMALELTPGIMGVNYELAVSMLLQDDFVGASRVITNESSEVFRQLGTALVLHASGQENESAEISQKIIDKYGVGLAYYIGQVMAYRGLHDEAFHWLNAAYEAGDSEIKGNTGEPLLRNLHNDPRWRQLLARMERLPEQLNAIEFVVPLLPIQPTKQRH